MPSDIHIFKNAASTASIIYVKKEKCGLKKILLIKRKHEPFAGCWALPGGFLNCDEETLEQAAIRELYEETNLVAQEENIGLVSVQSDPKRDPRGHVIDHVFFVLKCSGEFKAKDDAESLEFFSLEELPELAFDHSKVIQNFVNSSVYYH